MWEARLGGTSALRMWMWALYQRWRQGSAITVPLPNFSFSLSLLGDSV